MVYTVAHDYAFDEEKKVNFRHISFKRFFFVVMELKSKSGELKLNFYWPGEFVVCHMQDLQIW